jgi:hypothetical protein
MCVFAIGLAAVAPVQLSPFLALLFEPQIRSTSRLVYSA